MLAFVSVQAFNTVCNSNMTIAQAIAHELVFKVPRSEVYVADINGKNVILWDIPF